MTPDKESCFGAKMKYQFILILDLFLIISVNDWGGDYDNSNSEKLSKKKKDCGMFCNDDCEGIQQDHCKIEGCLQSRNMI